MWFCVFGVVSDGSYVYDFDVTEVSRVNRTVKAGGQLVVAGELGRMG